MTDLHVLCISNIKFELLRVIRTDPVRIFSFLTVSGTDWGLWRYTRGQKRHLESLWSRVRFPAETYTLSKSSKWYIVYICRVFHKGLIADKFYPWFNLECIIRTNNFVFIHLKFSCQNRFTRKMMASKATSRLKQEETRYRICCASINLFSEDSFRWLQKWT